MDMTRHPRTRNRAHPPVRRAGADDGFTLVELMAVMAIVALIVGMVSLSIEAILPGERLNTSIRELASELQRVRTEAISRSMPFRLIYDLDSERYRIATPFQVGGGRILTEDDPMDDEQRFYAPWTPMREGVVIQSVFVGGVEYTDGEVFVRFDPLGSATDHTVVLAQPDYGSAFTIEVLGLTGLIKMHDGIVFREPATDSDFN